MTISAHLFEACLRCPTKGWLRSTGEPTTGNAYAEWVTAHDEECRLSGIKRLTAGLPDGASVAAPAAEKLKTATWQLATDVPLLAGNIETRLHAVERVPPEGRGKAAQFIPIRFVWRNKLRRDDKLLLAFDALALSETLDREVQTGKIIHGDNSALLNVKLAPLVKETRKLVEKHTALLSSPTPPDLVLNRHCAECEFQARCRKIAVEKDDLSLLARMNAKERQKFRNKGIFTVTQLSYTFRPRRRPKRQRDKREKYHHSLKALAIREKKIHIVGSPELKIEGTPVYLDVEGLPDRDFYYLIGVRIGNGESAVQHSLWADTVADEGKIWREFLGILETVEKPVLIHYGSYETIFLRRMCERYGLVTEESVAAMAMKSAVNLLSFFFAHVYFSTFSNGLKEIAKSIGFRWSDEASSGLQTIVWRNEWEHARVLSLRNKLTDYNVDDCRALALLTEVATRLAVGRNNNSNATHGAEIVSVESLRVRETMWPRFKSPLTEFEEINRAARWDYQRERVYVRSSKRIRRIALRTGRVTVAEPRQAAKAVKCPEQVFCPYCGGKGCRNYQFETQRLHDIHFSRVGVRRRIVEYRYRVFWCSKCQTHYGKPDDFWPGSKYGRNLVAYLIYHLIELYTPMGILETSVNRLFGLNLTESSIAALKRKAVRYYEPAHKKIFQRVTSGDILHVDETRVSVRGKAGQVWVFTNLHEVAYVYSDTREAEFVQPLLEGFRGVLISDFYAVYDSFDGPQQKCLLHLIRDLNQEMLNSPYDEELKAMVREFAVLLRAIVATVDRFGLKKHFLRKHTVEVERFNRRLDAKRCQSEAATKCRQRFMKNRDKLFAFLAYDGVPWNNNNAEHAIKAFARLRDILRGSCTPKAIQSYLVLLSVCQSCKYMGVDFLDFLRSGEKDVHAFAERRRRRGPARQSPLPSISPVGPATQAIGAGGLAT